MENFGPTQQELLRRKGYLLVDGEFALGRTLFEEFRHYQPMDDFLAHDLPSLIVHGDKEASVSYEIARSAAENRLNCTLHTVAGEGSSWRPAHIRLRRAGQAARLGMWSRTFMPTGAPGSTRGW